MAIPLSDSLSIISFSAASSLDTDLLIMPTQVSVGTLVWDQSLTDGVVLRAGKLCRQKRHQACMNTQLDSKAQLMDHTVDQKVRHHRTSSLTFKKWM